MGSLPEYTGRAPLKESRLPMGAPVCPGEENFFTPRLAAMKNLTTPPQRAAAARSQLDTSQRLSQVLNLRDTDREHRVKVCVLAPRLNFVNATY
jgi:hypothetical protein